MDRPTSRHTARRSTSRSRSAVPTTGGGGGGGGGGAQHEQTREPVHFRASNPAQAVNPYYVLYEQTAAALRAYVEETRETVAVLGFDSHRVTKRMHTLDGREQAQNTLVLELESVTQIASVARLLAFLRAELSVGRAAEVPVDLSARRSSTSAEHFYELHIGLVPELVEREAPPAARGLGGMLRLGARVLVALALCYAVLVLGWWLAAKLALVGAAASSALNAVREGARFVGSMAGGVAPAAAAAAAAARHNPSMIVQAGAAAAAAAGAH